MGCVDSRDLVDKSRAQPSPFTEKLVKTELPATPSANPPKSPKVQTGKRPLDLKIQTSDTSSSTPAPTSPKRPVPSLSPKTITKETSEDYFRPETPTSKAHQKIEEPKRKTSSPKKSKGHSRNDSLKEIYAFRQELNEQPEIVL